MSTSCEWVLRKPGECEDGPACATRAKVGRTEHRPVRWQELRWCSAQLPVPLDSRTSGTVEGQSFPTTLTWVLMMISLSFMVWLLRWLSVHEAPTPVDAGVFGEFVGVELTCVGCLALWIVVSVEGARPAGLVVMVGSPAADGSKGDGDQGEEPDASCRVEPHQQEDIDDVTGGGGVTHGSFLLSL